MAARRDRSGSQRHVLVVTHGTNAVAEACIIGGPKRLQTYASKLVMIHIS